MIKCLSKCCIISYGRVWDAYEAFEASYRGLGLISRHSHGFLRAGVASEGKDGSAASTVGKGSDVLLGPTVASTKALEELRARRNSAVGTQRIKAIGETEIVTANDSEVYSTEIGEL